MEEEILRKVRILAIARQEFKALEDKFNEETADMQERIKELESDIKEFVIESKQSIKSEDIDVIYSKGRESWDGKILTGYAVAHPEILAALKVGNPTVSFRLKRK